MAFRRVIFSGDEVEDVKKDIERTFNILKAKMDASGLKRTIKNGAKPNTLLVDLNGEGADSISKKLKEILDLLYPIAKHALIEVVFYIDNFFGAACSNATSFLS